MLQTSTLNTATPFVSYAYAYPHKSAYRRLAPPIPLDQLWAAESQDSLFLYLHIPFCEYRCGFCNLFTLANARESLVDDYLRQLAVEVEVLRSIVPQARFSRVAFGGGTPTFLTERELERLLDITRTIAGRPPIEVPVSCEASPATLTQAKASLLRDWGVDRVSLGVQSFLDQESRLLGRPQTAKQVDQAIDAVRHAGIPTLNLDLIFGGPAQTLDSWTWSIAKAIEYRPQEIYLYPLYVREQTGLGRTNTTPNNLQMEAYRIGRDQLLQEGYRQRSLRMFQLPGTGDTAAPTYCCQSDGMIGLGCGARSYTRRLHYSTEFAVGRSGVRAILADYLSRRSEQFRIAAHGFRLNEEERRRRYVIQSLLQATGLDRRDYQVRFGGDVLAHLPQLYELPDRGLAELTSAALKLTPRGLELSDAIGPWLYSQRVRALMEEFECL